MMTTLYPLKVQAPRLTAIYGRLKSLFWSVTLFTTLIVFNGIQALSVLVKPFSAKAFRAINRWCANSWWGLCVIVAESSYGLKLVMSGDVIPYRENAIVFCNHQQMPDVLALMILGWRAGRLGDLKWFVKDPIKWVPGIGWGMKFLNCVFLKRNWDADREHIMKTFSAFSENNIPVWMISFSEGTRITEEKLKKSQDYARRHNLPVLENVLLPRTKGFVATVTGLRNSVKAVYDITIGYPHGIPTIGQMMRGFMKEVHIHVRRFKISEIPIDPEELSTWLVERFVEKDRRLAAFARFGTLR